MGQFIRLTYTGYDRSQKWHDKFYEIKAFDVNYGDVLVKYGAKNSSGSYKDYHLGTSNWKSASALMKEKLGKGYTLEFSVEWNGDANWDYYFKSPVSTTSSTQQTAQQKPSKNKGFTINLTAVRDKIKDCLACVGEVVYGFSADNCTIDEITYYKPLGSGEKEFKYSHFFVYMPLGKAPITAYINDGLAVVRTHDGAEILKEELCEANDDVHEFGLNLDTFLNGKVDLDSHSIVEVFK